MSSQSHVLQAIRDGVCIPADRKAAGWDRFLKDLGLVMTDKPVQGKKKDPKIPGEILAFPILSSILFLFPSFPSCLYFLFLLAFLPSLLFLAGKIAYPWVLGKHSLELAIASLQPSLIVSTLRRGRGWVQGALHTAWQASRNYLQDSHINA